MINLEITSFAKILCKGLKQYLKNENIKISWVPGSFELVYGCKELSKQNLDAIIAIGCVIKGETDHYDFTVSYTHLTLPTKA